MTSPLGAEWRAPFLASPFWLRFDLAGEVGVDRPVARFTQAFDRARTLADALFAPSADVTAILAASPDAERDVFAPERDPFGALDALGPDAPAPMTVWSAPLQAGDDEPLLEWRAVALRDRAMRDVLLWVAIAYELPIAPKAPVQSWLVDFERGLMLHVYDDRGMDVRALEKDAIAPLYREHDAWLLAHDRPRMRRAFAPMTRPSS